MSITRYRLADDSVANAHPEGEVVRYEDHAKEVERLRNLLDKQAEQARRWKTAYLACSVRGYVDA